MLVLSRRKRQTVVIGGEVIIQVQEIRGNRVAIGIDAPDGIRILRGELQEDDEYRTNDSDCREPVGSLCSVF